MLLTAVVLAAATASAPATSSPSPHRVALGFGFSHWFGKSLGNPDGFTTPTVRLGVRPGVSFLEVRARWSSRTKALDLPNGSQGRVGFFSIEAVASRELRIGSHVIDLYAGPLAVFAHANTRGVGTGFGLVMGVEYLFVTNLPGKNAMGFFVETRGLYYRLPGETLDLLRDPRRDAQIDIGFATAFF